MAFTPFYLIAGGTGSADINAGSTIGAAPNAAATGGSWTNATNTFVATGGTPFAGANVGDYVSVYADGATVTTYVAQITTVVSNVSVILSGTIKYGTAPTDGAANRSAVLGGSWNTEQVLAAGGLATTTVPQSTKINIKNNLTIAASRTISMVGATTTPLWFSGYNTNPGDLDADTTNSLAKPIWTVNATFVVTASGTYQTWSGLSVVGNRSGTVWTGTGAVQTYSRMRFDNTSANAAAIAFNGGSATSATYAYSWFRAPTSATTSGAVLTITVQGVWIGCVFEGGGKAGANCAGSGSIFISCVALNNTGNGLLHSSANPCRFVGCTVYNSTSDGISITAPTAGQIVVGCLLAICGGYGINNTSGANTGNVYRSCNDFYSCTPGPENGFGDSPAWFQQTDGSSPVTSATNMTPLSTSNAFDSGFPGIFENQTYSSYAPSGAVVAANTGGGGGVAGIIGDGASW